MTILSRPFSLAIVPICCLEVLEQRNLSSSTCCTLGNFLTLSFRWVRSISPSMVSPQLHRKTPIFACFSSAILVPPESKDRSYPPIWFGQNLMENKVFLYNVFSRPSQISRAHGCCSTPWRPCSARCTRTRPLALRLALGTFS